MGYGTRIKQALLGLDDRYANSIRNYQVNPKSPQWIASNIPVEAAQPLSGIFDVINTEGLRNRQDYIDAATTTLGAVGSRYLVPMTSAGLSLVGLTRAFAGQEEQY